MRPKVNRTVCSTPDVKYFKPNGIPVSELEEVVLAFDEHEAIKLADVNGLYQEAAALRMGISRQTFGRILESAHRKIADSIVNAKALRIEGGKIKLESEEKIMKIAVASKGNIIDDHFGHCEHFKVFTVDNNRKIISEEIVKSPEGCGCRSGIAGELAASGVTLMLAGNMGGGAVQKLASFGIEVVRGCSGDTRKAVENYLAGSLNDNGTSCSAHEGHNCGHHE